MAISCVKAIFTTNYTQKSRGFIGIVQPLSKKVLFSAWVLSLWGNPLSASAHELRTEPREQLLLTTYVDYQEGLNQDVPMDNILHIVHSDATPTNIQSKILDAFNYACTHHNNESLRSIISELANPHSRTTTSRPLYWKSYALYYNSLYLLRNSNKKQAKEELSKGIEVMEGLKQKDAEDYTLLAMLHYLSCHFLGFPRVIMAGRNATNAIEKSIELKGNNVRTYYVQAFADYHRPTKFGGGKKVESLLEKAISLPVQQTVDEQHPSWGRLESFELLSDFYIREKKLDKARKYIELGLTEFPESKVLNENQKKL